MNPKEKDELREFAKTLKYDLKYFVKESKEETLEITRPEAEYLLKAIEAFEENQTYISQLENQVGEEIASRIIENPILWLINNHPPNQKEEHPQPLDAGDIETAASINKNYRDELLDETAWEYVESEWPEIPMKYKKKIAAAYVKGGHMTRENVLFDVENHIEKPLKRQLQASITAKEKEWQREKSELVDQLARRKRQYKANDNCLDQWMAVANKFRKLLMQVVDDNYAGYEIRPETRDNIEELLKKHQ